MFILLCLMSDHPVLDFSLLEGFAIPDSVFLLVEVCSGLPVLRDSSLGRLCVSRNVSISSRLSSCWHTVVYNYSFIIFFLICRIGGNVTTYISDFSNFKSFCFLIKLNGFVNFVDFF